MANYKVVKGANYRGYVRDVVGTMYSAGVHHFTLSELCEWGGIPNTVSLRLALDDLCLLGYLSVEPEELRTVKNVRVYVLNSAVWLKRGYKPE